MTKLNYTLEVNNLCVSYSEREVIKNANLFIKESEILGIVGESGCGKTTMLRAIMLLSHQGLSLKGSIKFLGKELTDLEEAKMRNLRGNKISMIPQNAISFMDHTKTISSLFQESISTHQGRIKKNESDIKAELVMRGLNLDNAGKLLRAYPFELSGGMCQKVAIALAMINKPNLILADEPTSALDIKSQLQFAKQMQRLKEENSLSLALVSHDLRIISRVSDRIAIMYGGEIIECGLKEEIIRDPKHPYTQSLLRAYNKSVVTSNIEPNGKSTEINENKNRCNFLQYCQKKDVMCMQSIPEDIYINRSHYVKCYKYDTDDEIQSITVSKELT